MKTFIRAFLCSIVLTGAAMGMEVKPTNFSGYSSPGTFSFDFITTGSPVEAADLQITIASISGPGTLTLDATTSSLIKDDPAYWLSGNSGGATSFKSGNSYIFGDNADDPPTASLDTGDKIARFAFTWDTPGNYVFNMNLGQTFSFIDLADFTSLPITLPTGTWYSGPVTGASTNSFTVTLVPEPVSIVLFGLGGLMALKRRIR